MRERFDTMQLLRGAACLLVVVYHAAEHEALYGLGFSPLCPVRWFGYAGVDLFFVLSGFIIAATTRTDLGRPARLPGYLFRRAWRVYPTYWAALLASVAVAAAFALGPILGPDPWGEAANTLLLLPGPGNYRFLGVAWSLTYELMFYAAVGGLFLLPAGAAAPAALVWAVAVCATAVTGFEDGGEFARLAVSPFVLEFLAGFLLGRTPARLSGRAAVLLGLAAAGWSVVGTVATFTPDPHSLAADLPRRVAVFGPPAVLSVLALTGWERGGGRAGLGWLRRVGDASYSIYLLHVPGMVVVQFLSIGLQLPHTRAYHLGWIGAMIVAGLVPGFCLHRYVEAPLLRLGRRRPASAAAPAPDTTLRRAA